jgi:exodeoxyribonuclease I
LQDREDACVLVPRHIPGVNSISFDEEFLRQAFYQCLHPVFLTNTNGNARADVLNLMRAATTLHPTVIRPGVEIDGLLSHRLGALAAANGIVQGRAHDAESDVDAVLGLCRLVRDGAPGLWSHGKVLPWNEGRPIPRIEDRSGA